MTQPNDKPPRISKFIVIIRPEFMLFCKDACRAATLNHLLFRIAGKSKGQPKERMQEGQILFYAKNELLVEEMANAWGVCKVRGEVNELVKMEIMGRCSNPDWGVDRTKHFYFGKDECAKFVELCENHGVCVVHLDLPPEVKHLIYSSNANDKSIKCTCPDTEKMDANDESIECNSYIHQMHSINPSLANDKSIEAIYKEDYKDNTKKTPKKEESVPPATSMQPSLEETSSSETHSLFEEENANVTQVEAAPPKKPRTIKPPKPKIDNDTQKRIDRVYESFSKLGQEATKNPSFAYSPTKKATDAIKEWLKTNPTEATLKEVYLALWNTPKDTRTGFDWKENMTIPAVLNQYTTRSMAIEAKRRQQEARHVVIVPTKTTYQPPLEEDDELPFIGPASARRKLK